MPKIVLFQPQIPPNTGNIARLCVATDSELHIIRPLGFFMDDRTMKRAGCDYWEHLKLTIHDSLQELIQASALSAKFYYITKFGKKTYTEARFQMNDYLVFGSEQTGLPKEILENNADRTLVIPMTGPTRSLNLANSVAIVLYEALRQIS